jgi:hypothetical protein
VAHSGANLIANSMCRERRNGSQSERCCCDYTLHHRIVPNYRVLYSYGAVQAWAAAAAERAGSPDFEAVSRSLHSHEFDTVLGRIRFDEKGDEIPSGLRLVHLDGRRVRAERSDRLPSRNCSMIQYALASGVLVLI